MGLDYSIGDGRGHGRATINEYLMAAPGWPSVSVLLTYADVLIGVAASTRTSPRISVTASLSVYLTGPLEGGGAIEMPCHLTKSGRTVTVGETEILTDDGRPLGVAIGTFQASPRPQDTLSPRMTQGHRMERIESPHPTLADHVGLEVVEPGLTRIGLRPDLLNGTQSLQGGLVALLAEAAAQSAATADRATAAVVEGIEVHYLAAARVGPIQARAERVGPDLYRVTAHDTGMDDRIVCLVVARTREVG